MDLNPEMIYWYGNAIIVCQPRDWNRYCTSAISNLFCLLPHNTYFIIRKGFM